MIGQVNAMNIVPYFPESTDTSPCSAFVINAYVTLVHNPAEVLVMCEYKISTLPDTSDVTWVKVFWMILVESFHDTDYQQPLCVGPLM
jgi:hypothetical protein